MEIKGLLKNVLPVVERNGFSSRKVWITTDHETQYPQTVEVEVNGDKIDLFKGMFANQPVTVHVNLRGRLWKNPDVAKNPTGAEVCFNTLQIWKVEAGVAATAASPVTKFTAPAAQAQPLNTSLELPKEDPNEPIPF
jgi:hypothetical protein